MLALCWVAPVQSKGENVLEQDVGQLQGNSPRDESIEGSRVPKRRQEEPTRGRESRNASGRGKPRPEEREVVGGNSMCKGPEARTSLGCQEMESRPEGSGGRSGQRGWQCLVGQSLDLAKPLESFQLGPGMAVAWPFRDPSGFQWKMVWWATRMKPRDPHGTR